MRTSSLLVVSVLGALLAVPCAFSCSEPAADAGVADAAGPEGGEGGDAHVSDAAKEASTMATITSVTARAVGRNGEDLQVTVQGVDPTQTAYGAHIRVRDADSNKVAAFDGNWHGDAPGVFGEKTAERRVLFDPADAAPETMFTRTVTLHGILKAFPSIARIDFAVLTVIDKHSIKHFAEVTPQPVKSSGKECDPAILADRCEPGLGCIGTPPTCAKASAPAFTRVAYVPGPDGPHILFEGDDPAGVVAGAHVEFLDAFDGPQLVDMGSGNFTTSQDLDFGGTTTFGSLFFETVAPLGFESSVPRLAVTPKGTVAGSRATAKYGAPPLGAAGKTCDARGFTGCAAGSACMRDAASGGSVCTAIAGAKANVTAAAPTMDPSIGHTFATGYARGASLWDPPSECLAASALGRPEGIVRLHLAAPVASLTITTAVEETSFDSVVYLLAGSGDTEDSAIACNDDAAGSASTITVENLAAGDYTIVVDSKSMAGGQFGVKLQ